MTLCGTFKALGRRTWRLLDTGRAVGKQLGEETLTDLNVLDLKVKHPRLVHIREFTKRQESVEGADWEWWFVGKGLISVGFRVQAKILNIRSQTYRHLHYSKKPTPPTTGARTYQCDTLIQRAANAGYHVYPLYCLYSAWRSIRPKKHWHCPCVSYDRRLWGCAIVSAYVVRHLRHQGNQRHVRHLLPFMRPWHCLVCCQRFGRLTLPESAAQVWNAALKSERQLAARQRKKSRDQWPQRPVTTGRPPQHVLDVLEGKETDQPDEVLSGLLILSEGA